MKDVTAAEKRSMRGGDDKIEETEWKIMENHTKT